MVCPTAKIFPAPADSMVDMRIPDAEIHKALFDVSQIARRVRCGAWSCSTFWLWSSIIPFMMSFVCMRSARTGPTEITRSSFLADGDRFGAKVWREQKPLVLSPIGKEEAGSSDVIQEALEVGIHALI
jgi:hypothetical protein